MVGWVFMSAAALAAVKAVPAHWVLAVMVKMQPYQSPQIRVTYDETAEAIALAANTRPIFEGEDGAVKTAAFLLAIAWKESRFNPTAVGDNGASLGLFQIQAPTAHVTANMLLVPREAAPIAINLVKTSLAVCGHYGWHERLGWYAAGGNGCKESGRKKSVSRVLLAEKILREDGPSVTTFADNELPPRKFDDENQEVTILDKDE